MWLSCLNCILPTACYGICKIFMHYDTSAVMELIWITGHNRCVTWQYNSCDTGLTTYDPVCTLLQTDNHTSTPPLCFLHARCPSCRPTNSIKALKAHKALKAWHSKHLGFIVNDRIINLSPVTEVY